MRIVPGLTLVAIACLFAACVVQRNPVTGNKRAYAYTWSQERQIGAEADPAIIAQFGLYDDPELAAYVNRIGQEVVAESHLRRPETAQEFRETPFVFRVLDSPVVNAFALPGGYIYVTRGLMVHVQNQAQLAVILGHEVGHVAARHASKRAFQQQLGTLGLIGTAIGGSLLGLPGDQILEAGGSLAQLMFLSYGRDDERESDDLGVEYAAMSGYQAAEGAHFFETLKRISDSAGQEIPSFLSSHPDPGEREQTINRLAAEWESRTNMTVVGEDEHLAQIDGVVLGEDPRQGYVADNVFYHPELRFQFPVPRNWHLINQPTQVAMFNQEQSAILIFSFVQGASSAQQAANDFASQEGLTVVEQGRASGGYLPAHVVVVDVQNQDGTIIRAMAHFFEYGDNIYQFLGYSAQSNFNTYSSTFASTMQGFNRLAEASRIDVRPARLDVTSARRTGTFQSMVSSSLPADLTSEDLAIMNQVALNQSIPAGKKLKLVE
jgi:predicted Zn-dependent protease